STSGKLCASDLAAKRAVRDPATFHYAASLGGQELPVSHGENGDFCVQLPEQPGAPYMQVTLSDGVAKGKLVAHLYFVSPPQGADAHAAGGGYFLAGLERPEP